MKTVSCCNKAITSLALTYKYLIVSSEDCTIRILGSEKLENLHIFRHAHWVNSVCYSGHFIARFGIYGVARLFS